MTIGIIGLGLIGGSMAKAFRRDPESVILGMDTDERTVEAALLSRDMNGRLTEDKYGLCGLILLAAYPQGTEEWLRENAARIPAHVLVVDCLGVKGKICRTGFELAEQYGFTFVGGHPMAGTQYSGFRYAKEDMFDGSTMVLVYYIYHQAFKMFNTGYASAIAVILFMIVLILTIIQWTLRKKVSHYED